MSIKDQYENLSPKQKKLVLWGGGGILLVTALYFLTSEPEYPTAASAVNNKPVTNLLTNADTQGVSQESIAADLRRIDDRIDSLLSVQESYKKEVTQLYAQQKILENQKNDLATELKQQLDKQVKEKMNTPDYTNSFSNTGRSSNQVGGGRNLNDVYENDIPYSPNTTQEANTSGSDEEYPELTTYDGTNNHDSESKANNTLSKSETDENVSPELEGTYLPAGSIISTVALSGMDAPTAKAAREHPYPMLVRVKREAILPNNYTADIRDCAIISSGYGELSSERAYLRSNTISCIREDGAVIEATFDSYAVGEDGKIGIRGRLVTKQGQYLAKALIAGFLQAGSEMFSVQQIPSITLTQDGIGPTQSPYQQINSNKVQGAAMKGVGSALNRLADFYMDMAQDLFPVIEIDPARSIDFVVTKGVQLQFRQTN
ncbi:conjugal transfer protein TrbI [Providencia rettgeri]|uniref:TraB/VirB10 family protein n=1 Tax=Providencia rettgeri TaxID=587 RepID=UPI0011C6F533|nr:TraB/VirB10 family protein [Providencia rettgeri]TXM53785.1 conjugal transfer protein TrbI [Providencia rettgeri]TXM77743.1 conjugal transfer protein TrbI [Providencia rettgeri]